MTHIVDAIILALLCGAVCYAFYLHRRIRKLMAALEGLRPVVETFSEAIDRTEGSVIRLRSVAETLPAQRGGDWRGHADAPSPSMQELRAAAVMRMPAKPDLIRSFFDDARKRHA